MSTLNYCVQHLHMCKLCSGWSAVTALTTNICLDHFDVGWLRFLYIKYSEQSI